MPFCISNFASDFQEHVLNIKIIRRKELDLYGNVVTGVQVMN